MHFPLLVWEQRKFNKIANKIGATSSAKIPNVSYDDILSKRGVLNKKISKLSTGKKGIKFKENDILFGKLRPYLKNYLLADFSGIAIGDFWVLRPLESPDFLFYLIQSQKFTYISNISSGSKMPRSDWKLVSSFHFDIPKINEQIGIGKVLKLLDKLISLQQRKLKLFDQLRKTLLEYLISEQKIPIVRFNSFRKEWKVFRLQNLIIKTTKGKAKADMVGNRSIYLDTAYLNGGALSTVDAPTDVYKDDIVILWDGSLAGKVYHGFSGALGSTLKSFTPKYSGEYLFQYLQRSQEKIFKNYRTPNIPHVVKDFITIFKVNAPSLEEQNKISTILESIDLLIDNQNTKIKKWKKIKEHLLQKMFI
ncbi:restriction endonuclease subunit S [Lactobacillus johnsonii]|uniref:restriction endonuclease subunit S n=1 Tax=Lactobacillus johnsonii TaxID=33959 RepID=UPI0011B4F2D3|nr:restriction endonuclease subunit S [Lactobacillus johnsonii]TWU80604.1 Type I restriction modification DNA specificity domain protein [Lactobacillus johnsonii]